MEVAIPLSLSLRKLISLVLPFLTRKEGDHLPIPEGRIRRMDVAISTSIEEEQEEWMWPYLQSLKEE